MSLSKSWPSNCEVALLWLIINISKLLIDYLSNHKQQIKVENFFSKWENIETGVRQGSMAHFYSTFLFVTSSYTINQNADSVTKSLEELSILFKLVERKQI